MWQDLYQEESAAFQCKSFPDNKNTFHLLLLLIIPTAICKPLTAVLVTLFMMNSKTHVQVKWRGHSLLTRAKAVLNGGVDSLNWRRASGYQSKRFNLLEEVSAFSSNPVRYTMQRFGFGGESRGSERRIMDEARQAAKMKRKLKNWKKTSARRSLENVARMHRGYTQADVKDAKIAYVCESLAWAGCWISLAAFTYFIFVYGVAIYDNIEKGAQEQYVTEWLQNRAFDVLTTDFFRPLKRAILRSLSVYVLNSVFHAQIHFRWLEINWDAYSTGMVNGLSRILGEDAVLPGVGEVDVYLLRDSVTGFD